MTLYGLSAERTRTRIVDLTFTPPVAALADGGSGTVVLAPGVVAEAGGGAADVVPVAVVTVGAVSVKDRVGWSVPVPTDVLVVRPLDRLLAIDELLLAALPVDTTLLLFDELLVVVNLLVADVLMVTLVVFEVLVEEGFGVGVGLVTAHWENCEAKPSMATNVQKSEDMA